MINSDNVGRFYTTNGKDVWRLQWYCSEPSACMKNLETGEEIGGSVYSRNLASFELFEAKGGGDDSKE